MFPHQHIGYPAGQLTQCSSRRIDMVPLSRKGESGLRVEAPIQRSDSGVRPGRARLTFPLVDAIIGVIETAVKCKTPVSSTVISIQTTKSINFLNNLLDRGSRQVWGHLDGVLRVSALIDNRQSETSESGNVITFD